ncbi:MAG: 2-oxoacid:ferredoxin oxidoreductase subunit beta [Planctomycetota bacterium]|nr:2-oxoacid:ferredoxin oxidoreductase subunit beta [Planctomycetota bacterium]
MTTASNQAPLSKKDFKSDQDVRWCPGCGDYGILNAVQSAFAKLGKNLHDTVVISGIGCSSRFPYYMETFGFHTIHGRAPALATGVKVANPDLDVWLVTGDGDAMSIGGNHFIHLLRRNVGIKVLLFNNRIYGLTKGQYSPTSEQGKKTKSTPMGSIDHPMSPVSLALGAGATFIGRSIDTFGPHLENVIMRAAAHEGTALVEIYQNCNIFNDGAFDSFREKSIRAERTVELEHGKPVVFGADSNRGLRLNHDLQPEIVTIGENGITEADVMVWDEADTSPARAMAFAAMSEADFPVPLGILRNTTRPAFEKEVNAQVQTAQQNRGDQKLQDLLNGPDRYTI